MIRLLILLFSVCIALTAQLAMADPVRIFIRMDCNKDLGFLQIERINLDQSVIDHWDKVIQNNLFKQYGLIDTGDLIEYQKKASTLSSNELIKNCQMTASAKPVTYKVTFQGFLGNPNPNGMCGGWQSFFVTIESEGKKIIDRLSFDQSCESQFSLHQITLSPLQDSLNILGDGITEENWFDSDFPVTNEKVYKPDN